VTCAKSHQYSWIFLGHITGLKQVVRKLVNQHRSHVFK